MLEMGRGVFPMLCVWGRGSERVGGNAWKGERGNLVGGRHAGTPQGILEGVGGHGTL